MNDMSMKKIVFLVSDRRWQDVLSLVPISIWTEPPSKKPLVIERPITSVSWLGENNGHKKCLVKLMSTDGNVLFGELSETGYAAGDLPASYSPCPLAVCLCGPLECESHLVVELEKEVIVPLPKAHLGSDEELMLYVAEDGSTYEDPDLEELVLAAPGRRVQRMMPALIYHQEEEGIDVDSTLHFLSSYLGRSEDELVFHIGPFPTHEFSVLIIDRCELNQEQVKGVRDMPALQRMAPSIFGEEVDTLVIARDDDYHSGLLAAAFASLLHGLLFFINPDEPEDYESLEVKGKRLYLIGDMDKRATEHFVGEAKKVYPLTCEDVQRLYFAQTLTDKLILVNPDDLHLEIEEYNPALLNNTIAAKDASAGVALILRFYRRAIGSFLQKVIEKMEWLLNYKIAPEDASAGDALIRRFYGKASLAAPFLAAGKHELILPIASIDYSAIDSFLQGTIERLGIRAQYLTIVAGPEAIPMASYHDVSYSKWWELDYRVYACDEGENRVNLAVGRIFGITVSDCSAYVARALFFDEIHRSSTGKALIIVATDQFRKGEVPSTCPDRLREHVGKRYRVEIVLEDFERWTHLGTNVEGVEGRTLYDQYREAELIMYVGHGDYNGWVLPEIGRIIDTTNPLYKEAYLNFPVIIGRACSTGAYQQLKGAYQQLKKEDRDKYKLTNLFAAQNLRRGAMGQQCAVSYTYYSPEACGDLLRYLYVEGLSLGEALCKMKNEEIKRHLCSETGPSNGTHDEIPGDPHSVLLGDPTFKPKRK